MANPNDDDNKGTTGLQRNGIEPNGIEPNGAGWNGIEPNAIEPNGGRWNGIEPNAIEPNGLRSNGASSTGTPLRLRALTVNGVRLQAGPDGLRIDALEVNGLRISAPTGLVLDSVELDEPTVSPPAPAPGPDFGAVSVSSIELPDGRHFDT